MVVFAEGSRGALIETSVKTLTLEGRKLERPGLHIHVPQSGEWDTAAVDEDRRLLMGGFICSGKFMVDVDSLANAAEKCCIKDTLESIPVWTQTHIPMFFLSSSTCLLNRFHHPVIS